MKIVTLKDQTLICGLSTTGIKVIALITMTADHIGKNLWLLLPPWLEIALQILGRCAAPLFAFAVVVGMQHTAHPWRYALRMYAASWVLLLGNALLEAAIPAHSLGFCLPNDVFLTYTVLIVFLIVLRDSVMPSAVTSSDAIWWRHWHCCLLPPASLACCRRACCGWLFCLGHR